MLRSAAAWPRSGSPHFLNDRQTRKPSAHTMKAYRQDFIAIATVTGGQPARLAITDMTKESITWSLTGCSIRSPAKGYGLTHRHVLPIGGDRSALVPQRVSGRLRADQAFAKHKSVDAIVTVRCRRISGPLQEQQVAIEDLGLQCPGCVRQISKQLGEPGPDTFLATQDPAGCDEDRVVRIIGRRSRQGRPPRAPWRGGRKPPPACVSSLPYLLRRTNIIELQYKSPLIMLVAGI
jgi:hypothetical protein